MVANGARLYRVGLYLDDWNLFLEEAGGHRIDRGTLVPDAPRLMEASNVSYSCQDAERPALDDVSPTVRRGEIVALIGENGSGKSTLLKLISALYLPTRGVVSWDGVPTGQLDAQAAWKYTARVPQEFSRWPMTARENIHLGQPPDDGDRAVLAADRAALLAAHNLSNVVVADRIVVMKDGRIVQQGDWARLSTGPGLFRELLELSRDRAIPGQRPAVDS